VLVLAGTCKPVEASRDAVSAPLIFMPKVRGISLKTAAIWVIVIAITGIGAARLFSKKTEDTVQVNAPRQVKVASVAELAKASTPLTLLGTVSSKSEAIVRAESAGKLLVVYKKLGDYVAAGGVIAEFENATQKAIVTQAEGAYEAAKAARDVAGISSGSASDALAEQRIAALSMLSTAYTAMDDAVHAKTDVMWENPQDRSPHVLFQVSDDKLRIAIESERESLEPILDKRAQTNSSITSENDISSELSKVADEVRMVRDYLDNLALALARAVASPSVPQASIDGWKTAVGISRAAIGASLDSVLATRNRLTQLTAAADIAAKQGNGNGASSADAALKSALGNLDAAKASLEKTIVRSPISGTINSLSVETGDIVSMFSDIAVVSNNNALEIVAYVTENEKRELSVGAKVLIENIAQGVVTRIAPAIDPKTGKIEVRIGITGNQGAFVNGQSASASIARRATDGKSGNDISLPVAAIKLTPAAALVFTANESGTLVAVPVTIGAIQGEKIVITDGLTPEMIILTDARGLKEGMVVEVSKSNP
jgi:RND family efflux transporter MFP subunit